MIRGRTALVMVVAAACVAGFVVVRSARAKGPETPAAMGRRPVIRPDYSDVVAPPNIAPLNFVIQEPGDAFQVEIKGDQGHPITIQSETAAVRIPLRAWRELLAANNGGQLRVSVSARQAGGGWEEFAPIEESVAREETDPYLVYRLIAPIHNLWHDVGIYQRDLRGWDERLVFHGRYFSDGCTNCHSFTSYHTGTMAIGVRSKAYGSGTVLVQGGKAMKLDAMWGYTSWHPNGRVAAYSLNRVRQFFHPARRDQRDVVDLDSDIVIYTLGSDVVRTTPALSQPDRLETYPSWSPDGRFLYFCSAPILWTDRDTVPPARYHDVRYDLRRVAYDPQTGQWGAAETVLSAAQTGKSILLPRVSPDGRFLLFCMCDYGCFPVYEPSSDLYMMDLRTRRYWRPGINSDRSESWHCWSSNGHWIVFSSKRQDGVFTRSYLSHVDEVGRMSKPLVLPQEDPALYDRQVKTYSVPEFTVEPVRTDMRTLAAAARTKGGAKLKMPDISMTRKKPDAKQTSEGPWRERPGR